MTATGRSSFPAALAFGVVCLPVIAWLGGALRSGEPPAFDRAVSDWCESLHDREFRALDLFMSQVTHLGGETALVIVAVTGAVLLGLHDRYGTMGFWLGTIIGTRLLSILLKLLVARPRPGATETFLALPSASFPSAHAMMSLTVYVTAAGLLAPCIPRPAGRVFLFALAGLLTLCIGASRVYLGVHYASDVLAGWLLGAVCTALCWTGRGLMTKRGDRPGG